MDALIGFGILFLILFVIFVIGITFFQLLCESIWLRIITGGVLIWLIWASVTPENEPFAWMGTVIIGLGILSPWLIVIGIGGAIVGYLITRR